MIKVAALDAGIAHWREYTDGEVKEVLQEQGLVIRPIKSGLEMMMVGHEW